MPPRRDDRRAHRDADMNASIATRARDVHGARPAGGAQPRRADGRGRHQPRDPRGAGRAVRQHEPQQPRIRARQQHDRERPARDPGAREATSCMPATGAPTCPISTTRPRLPSRSTCRPPCRTRASPTTRPPGRGNYVDNLIGMPVQVYDDATVCAGVITNRLADTDVLIVRHAEPCVPGGLAELRAVVAGRLYFQSTLCLDRCRPDACSTRRASR